VCAKRADEFISLFPPQKTNKKQKTKIIDENNNGVYLWHTRWKSRIKNILFFFFFFFSQTVPAFIFGALSRRARQQQQQQQHL
jgi:hypothetical protein